MRFTSTINNVRLAEWGINITQGALVDLINQASSWAKAVVIDGVTYYWMSFGKVCEELPSVFNKEDTVYRQYKVLKEKGIIEHFKMDGKDYVRLTEKGCEWNKFEPIRDSGKNPSVGNQPEQTRKKIRESSEKNPTDNNNNNKYNQDQNNPPVSPQGEPLPAETKKSQLSVEVENPETVDLPDYVNRESWVAYCQMRKAKRSAIKTKKTLELCLRDLEKHSGGDPKLAIAILEQSTANCWTGIFALKTDFRKPSGATNAHDKSGAWAVGRTINVKVGAMR